MGIKATTNPGSYLCVSFLWGKKRREVLNYIVDRVRGKLKSWKQQSLSYGGKEILIKVIASAVPTYLMACFKFPVQICNMLNASTANFLWGQKEDEKKIHWKSWMKLTMAKSLGGLGFKDVKIFNKALLAKQCWRLLNEPDALWAKVMKGIYFHDRSIFKARKGGRASWAWSVNR